MTRHTEIIAYQVCADYRLLADRADARFALSEAAVGVPFPDGPMEIIRQEVPMPLLRQMTLTRRPAPLDVLVEAQLFDEVVSHNKLTAHAVETAKQLDAQPAIMAVKRQLRGDLAQRVRSTAEPGDEAGFG